MKKITIFLGTLLISLGVICSNVLDAQANNSGEATVSRLEWLKALTEAFQMEVEEQNYPDNYYSDVDSSSADYYDIMLATEFGLVDVEAGGELRPNEPATREFAAHTLNLCAGYFSEEQLEYTFSEVDSVTYADDIQIAINKGWLELSGNDFLPNQGITIAEKEKMIAVAKEVVASTVIDENYEGSFELVEGVVVVPEGTEAILTDENELTIYDCPVELKTGDIFVVFSDGFPVAKKALNIIKNNTATIISVENVKTEEAFKNIDMQSSVNADLTQIQAVDEDVELAYIVGGTEEQNYEDGVAFYSLAEVDEQKVTAVVATKKIKTPAKFSNEEDEEDEFISVSCKVTDVTADTFASLQKAYVKVNAKVTFSCELNLGEVTAEDLGLDDSFIRVPIGAIGYFQPSLDFGISGSVTVCMENRLTIGVQWTPSNGFRLINDFKKEAFTIQVEIKGYIGIKAEIGVDAAIIKTALYARVGAEMTVEVTAYMDDKLPNQCLHLIGNMYLAIGAEISLELLLDEITCNLEMTIFDSSNSPVKFALHFEDGEHVSACTRDGDGSVSNPRKYGYYSPINSQYAFGGSNTGKTASGETYAIFDYTLDDNNQATITKYNGNHSAISIPSTLDGYTVVGIGNSAFYGNTKLRMVRIPDTVEKLEVYAFAECINLNNVMLSKSITYMETAVFKNCDALTSIEIPKSLEDVEYDYNWMGPFVSCDNLKIVTFEEGTTKIAPYLFYGCTGIEEIVIPDTVTTIGQRAFGNCSNLKRVVIPDTVTNIESMVFSYCPKLTNVDIPKDIEQIGMMAFYSSGITSIKISKNLENLTFSNGSDLFSECDNLKTVIFEEGITKIPEYLFEGCPGIEEIVIPDSITTIGGDSFLGCTSLEKVVIPDTVTTIGNYAFSQCGNLTEINIPGSLANVGYGVFSYSGLTSIEIPKNMGEISLSSVSDLFYDCSNLKTVTFEKGITKIPQYLFEGCTGTVEEIEIPNTVKTIGNYSFASFTNLKTVTIPRSVTMIENATFYNPETLTVKGYNGSYAQEWAETVGATFIVLEDEEIPVYVEIQGAVDEETSVELYDANGNKIASSNVAGSNSQYPLADLTEGTYTMKVSKDNYVPRTYTIEVGTEVVQLEVKLHKFGDITGDGVINARDKKTLFNHIAGTSKLKNYDFDVADVNGDGVINARDKKMVFNHIAGTNSLWK